MRKSLGIIGFGRFGQISAIHLKKYFRVFVSDCIDFSEDCGKLLIRQFINENHGVDVGEVLNTNQEKFDFAVKKAQEYFLNDK